MNYQIIDFHTHVYPAKIAARATESIGKFYDIPMKMDGTVDTLIQNSREAGVCRNVIHSAAVDAAHVVPVNDFIIRTVGEHPDTLSGFMTLHPDMEDPGKEVERCLKAGLKGVKLHPDMQKFALNEKRTEKLYAVCQGVCPMLLHTGDERYAYSNPSQVPGILKKFPGLTLICAHLGGYSEWTDADRLLPDTNVYVDCSSSFFAMTPEEAKKRIGLFGAERVLFGSDYPMWNVKDEIRNLLDLGLDEESLRKIFSGNASRLLQLEK